MSNLEHAAKAIGSLDEKTARLADAPIKTLIKAKIKQLYVGDGVRPGSKVEFSSCFGCEIFFPDSKTAGGFNIPLVPVGGSKVDLEGAASGKIPPGNYMVDPKYVMVSEEGPDLHKFKFLNHSGKPNNTVYRLAISKGGQVEKVHFAQDDSECDKMLPLVRQIVHYKKPSSLQLVLEREGNGSQEGLHIEASQSQGVIFDHDTLTLSFEESFSGKLVSLFW